jgi:chromosome segregation ATPase
MPQRQLGELMTELGLISEEQLATVLEVQQRSKRPLGQIIVELGFASGAAVAHALAMQSGGALKTEYGFALGVHPEHGDRDADEMGAGLPKLRLAATAVVPERADEAPMDEPQTDDGADVDAAGERVTLALPPAAREPEPVEHDAQDQQFAEIEAAEDTTMADPPEVAAESEETTVAEPVEVVPEVEEVRAAEPDSVELEQQRAEVERLEAALAETRTAHEQELARLRDEHEHATAELARLGVKLSEAQTSAAELERRLDEERERHAAERGDLTAQRDGLQEELGFTLERLADLGTAAEERDRLRAEAERFENTLAETQATAAGEHERLRGELERLEGAAADAQAAHEQELAGLREEHDHARAELERLQTRLAEAQTAAAEHERRLADEQEQRAAERDELNAHREGLQEELGATLDRLAAIGPAAEERDQLRGEVEELRAAGAETQEACAAEVRRMVEERDNVTVELEEAREMLRQAERVRESQIALVAERDRALAELERLEAVATEAQEAASEQNRLLAEEQDRRYAERESLVAQRTLLEEELGDAIEQLAAAASAADAREQQLHLAAERVRDVLDDAQTAASEGVQRLEAVRRLAAELTSTGEELPEEDEPETPDSPSDPTAETEADQQETEDAVDEGDPAPPDTEPETLEYSLFVPGPNGYELVPQTGVPPQAGETVELVFPDRDEPAVFEVVRSGRTLPGGDVCVYLAQV